MSESTDIAAAGPQSPRFTHPKILAVDLPAQDVADIRAGGFNVAAGSFGTPVEVRRSGGYAPVNVNGHLPGITEQQIVVADLRPPSADPDAVLGEEPIDEGVWQRMDRGVIDPRPYFMLMSRFYFERVYEHGGVFILFAAVRSSPGYSRSTPHRVHYGQPLPADNWSLLNVLGNLEVSYDLGTEITPAESSGSLFAPIGAALRSASFECLVEPSAALDGRWTTWARSKYGGAVAGLIEPEPGSGQGAVIVLPRIERKGELVRYLLESVLPNIARPLFPEDERQAWVEEERYAPPAVAALRTEIEEVEATAAERVGELEAEIAARRAEDAHLRALLTATGGELVAAVKKTLESLGFTDVGDVDAEEGAQDGRLREDLQIRTESPVVLSEVKGINNLPRDDDALEVGKYILPRIREWGRTDVRGLTIVNHQRGLPPADRDTNVFQGDQIENAEGQGIGLLAAVDLYRLARGFERNGWRHEQVASLFTTVSGRVEPLPTHYEPIGEVVNFYEKAGALTVQLRDGIGLAVGEKVAYELPLDFAEEPVAEIQVDGTEFDPAPPGAHVGLKTNLTKREARKGTRVYRVGSWS
jgi:hypothetical protein